MKTRQMLKFIQSFKGKDCVSNDKCEAMFERGFLHQCAIREGATLKQADLIVDHVFGV